MLINECKPEFQFKKSSKNAKFGQCSYLVAHLCYEQNRCAERTVTLFKLKFYEAKFYQIKPFAFLLALRSLKDKYGEGKIVKEVCKRCGYEGDIHTAGTHENNGCIKVYSEADKFACPFCCSDQGTKYLYRIDLKLNGLYIIFHAWHFCMRKR